jgi:hypothetical protein
MLRRSETSCQLVAVMPQALKLRTLDSPPTVADARAPERASDKLSRVLPNAARRADGRLAAAAIGLRIRTD